MKKALLVGINHYSMPGSDLRGCLNDVETNRYILTYKFGFQSTEMVILRDSQATTKNIKDNLEKMVAEFKDCNSPEDKFIFCYSGHGSSVPDKDGDEIDKLDEIICPYDLNWTSNMITDDYLYSIFSKINPNVQLLIISDSCHSGSLLRSLSPHNGYYKNKYLVPPESIFNKIKSQIYDNDAAMADLMGKIRNKKEDFNTRNGILISGCQSNQTSADAEINGKPCGAMTYVLGKVLNDSNYDITYADLIVKMNKLLDEYGYEQNPQLECPDIWRNKKFLK